MSNFDEEFARFEAVLGRGLSREERNLLVRWEAFVAGTAAGAGAGGGVAPEPAGPEEHDGRFKISFVKGEFEVGFVCSSLMLRGVRLTSEEDVIAFLTQDPIFLDEARIRQAMAAARNQRPSQVAQNVSLSEPLLRSMGFQHL